MALFQDCPQAVSDEIISKDHFSEKISITGGEGHVSTG